MVRVLCLDARVAKPFVKCVSVGAYDVAAERDARQALCERPRFGLAHQFAANSNTPELMIDDEPCNMRSWLIDQRSADCGMHPSNDLPVVSCGNEDEMMLTTQDDLHPRLHVAGSDGITELGGELGKACRITNPRSSDAHARTLP